MSPPGCQKMSAKPCNRNAAESFPVVNLKSREQKPPNSLLIQDKDVLQPTSSLPRCGVSFGAIWSHRRGCAQSYAKGSVCFASDIRLRSFQVQMGSQPVWPSRQTSVAKHKGGRGDGGALTGQPHRLRSD